MNIIGRHLLVDFWVKYPKARSLLEHWFNVSENADWKSTEPAVATFPKAKALNSERMRFEFAGTYSLRVIFDFRRQITLVEFIGTPEQDDNTHLKKVARNSGSVQLRPIRDDNDYLDALKEIERLWGAKPRTSRGDALDVLVTLVGNYETNRWPIKLPDPVDTLKAHMAATGRNQSDLAEVLGSRPRASEIMSRKRRLSMGMVRKIVSDWRLSATVLIEHYSLAENPARKAHAPRKRRASKQ